MASTPGYDPNTVPDDLDQLNKADPSGARRTAAIQSLYPPGSTFKVVTAAAALDSGAATPDTTARRLLAAGVQRRRPRRTPAASSSASSTCATALTHSVNTYFAQLGEEVGAETLLEYMDRFGFGSDPEVQLPDDQKAASGIFVAVGKGELQAGRRRLRHRPRRDRPGRRGGRRSGRPSTQMAEVAATIANGGTLMKPTLVQQVVDPDGRVTDELDPEVQSEVVSEETASELADMMTSVVDEGTAAASPVISAARRSPARPAPPRSTSSRTSPSPGSSPSLRSRIPQIAIAVTTDPCTGCFGGAGRRPDRNGRDAGAARADEARARTDRRRPLPADRPDRLRRDGRRLARPRHRARPRRRAEAAARELRPRHGVRRAVPPRGLVGGRPAAPERRQRLRPRHLRGQLLHLDGAGRGLLAARPDQPGPDDRGGGRGHPAGARRRRLRPRARASSTAT